MVARGGIELLRQTRSPVFFRMLKPQKLIIGGFGNDFGKKGQRLPLALLIPIDLAEKAGFEPAVGD